MIGLLGEIVVEVVAYGTYGILEVMLKKIPLHWNKHVLKFICIILSILLWIGFIYIIIKILEMIL